VQQKASAEVVTFGVTAIYGDPPWAKSWRTR